MWADNETDVDLLGFDFLVDGLVIALSEPRLLPLTVGVLGDWGSGKSSLMGLACAELTATEESDKTQPETEAPRRYVCVRFSPWQYEDYEDVKVSLMSAVLARLGDEATDNTSQQEEVNRLKAFASKFRRRSRRVVRTGIGLLPAAVPAVASVVDGGFDPTVVTLAQQGVQAVTAGVAERLAEPAPTASPEDAERVTDVAEFRDRFAALVQSLEHVAAVVVFIDDLDRCLPETVVDTFEAIRLLLGAPRTAFVVAANQKIVETAVDARYPDLRRNAPDRDNDRSGGIGSQYLEKMLQLKITVPALAVPEAVTYINLLLAELHLSGPEFRRIRDHVAEQRATHTLEVAFDLGTLGDLGVAVPAGLIADLQWAGAIAPVLAAGSRGNPRQIKQFLNTLQLRRRSAARRKVTLEPAVLAKLMLSEDQHIDDFQQVFDWQIASGGPSCPELAAAEELTRPNDAHGSDDSATPPTESTADSAGESDRTPRGRRSKPRAAAPPVDDAVREWAEKPVVRAWLQLPPTLATVDLRPYFHYSRGQLSLAAVSGTRLSGLQRRLLGWLLGATDRLRREGIDGLANADVGDQGPIIEALAKALLTNPEEAFVAVCETVERIDGARDALLRALDRLPAAAVPVRHVPVAGARLPSGDPRTVALLNKWSSAGREDLAKMVDIVRRGPDRARR